MSLFRLSEIGAEAERVVAPICIVGAGIAGLLMARRIAAAGRRVVLLESGDADHGEEWQSLNEIEDPNGYYSRSLSGRHRGLGGTSFRWGGRMIPITDYETGPRRNLGQSGWPVSMTRFTPYQQEIETLFGLADGSFDTMGDESGGLEEGRFPADAETFYPRWAKCPSFRKCNLGAQLRRECARNANLEVWLDATVYDFRLDRLSGRLEALTARSLNGREITIHADRFVLAAGTIESTRLLLLLDKVSEQRAFERCRVLGRFFQDHLKAEIATVDRTDPKLTGQLFGYLFMKGTRRDIHLDLSAGAQVKHDVSGAFAYVSMDLSTSVLGNLRAAAHGLQERRLDVAGLGHIAAHAGTVVRSAYWRFARKRLYVPPDVTQRIFLCVEQLPHHANRISLGETRDRLGTCNARLEWKPTAADERTFRTAVACLTDYWKKSGLEARCPLRLSSAARDPQALITASAEACAHPSGSARMGTNPASSVTRPDLFCHAVPNLAVVSAAVFPTAGSANPTLTIMQLAYWAADLYLRATASSAEQILQPADAGAMAAAAMGAL
ncbi:GMC oxidoreductase [Mesorhizobium sp. RP14(2022)]|uniref:GMC oxidoreductase n=1 Tax=Mesorhizobium liriopis TaxID=2953882 RepID=A0ABT1C3P7_9HYPH|nr:GMC oxidoreductase [Mesorhizobium liriopis]MCO6049133.1 GMC oxidoreductase [Mesorhizobium liriopis]